MTESFEGEGGALTLQGVMVQAMAERGHELMVGARRDPVFGPCIVVGAGGIYTEITADFSFRMAPLEHGDAQEMLKALRVAPILAGARGQHASDLSSVVDIIQRVAQLVWRHPEIVEIDINPIIVSPHGATVVDARIIL